MSKKSIKKTRAQELADRLLMLSSKRLSIYKAGMSHQVMSQIDQMIADAQQELYDQVELDRMAESNERKSDDEGWIV